MRPSMSGGPLARWTGCNEDSWPGWLGVALDQAAHAHRFADRTQVVRHAGFTDAVVLGIGRLHAPHSPRATAADRNRHLKFPHLSSRTKPDGLSGRVVRGQSSHEVVIRLRRTLRISIRTDYR